MPSILIFAVFEFDLCSIISPHLGTAALACPIPEDMQEMNEDRRKPIYPSPDVK
jgi:hypothetical protein